MKNIKTYLFNLFMKKKKAIFWGWPFLKLQEAISLLKSVSKFFLLQ
jgi:hypothetical protein